MGKKIAELTCPECQKAIQVPFEVNDPPSLEEITNALKEVGSGPPGQIEEILKRYGFNLTKTEDHRHKTADEFLDCPECRLWVDTTAKSYQVVKKEPPAPPPEPEPEPEPEKEPAATRPPIGSIFSVKSGE